MREVNIAGYLPNIIREVKEFKEIINTENPEINLLWKNVQKVFDDQFVETATENGVKRWEKILKITPKASHTLADRKFVILTRLNEQLPYTTRILQQLLEQLCGQDGYVLSINHDLYELKILVELKSKNMVEAIGDLTKKVVPANMDISIKIRYNQYYKLKNVRHIDLQTFSHDSIRNEVIE